MMVNSAHSVLIFVNRVKRIRILAWNAYFPPGC